MAKKYVVYVTHGVYVDIHNDDFDPDNNAEDHEKLQTAAVLKMWTIGYNEVKTECNIEWEDVTEEFEED